MTNITDKTSGRIFYASPWLLTAASLLLAMIIAVFAVNNYQREKKLMTFAMVQEGQAVLNLVSSSARAAVRGEMMRGAFDNSKWVDIVGQIIENSSEHQGLVSLFLVSEKGDILVATQEEQVKSPLDLKTVDFLKGVLSEDLQSHFRIISHPGQSETVFQIASIFRPMVFRKEMPTPMREMMRGRANRGQRDRQEDIRFVPDERDRFDDNYFLIAELDMSEYRQSVRKQLVQLVILSFVLLLVGIGSLLSLIMLKGFKGSQLRLKKMSAFTDVLIQAMPVGIIAIDGAGVVRTCNPSSCHILGLKSAGILGNQATRILPEPLADLVTGKKTQLKEGSGTELACSIGNLEKNLHVVLVDIKQFEETSSGSMILLQDLTTQKKLENELRRNERHTALGKMAAGVAHELRNPLSSIKGLALLLKKKLNDTVPGEEAADVLVSEVERLDRSISELLDYARRDNLQLNTVDLKELIRKALVLINSDTDNAGIEIKETYVRDDLLIQGDPDKLTQVLLNILLNSIQAMPDGGTINIDVTTHLHTLKISVKDDGTGIAEHLLEKIFDPYFTTKNDGTGLGLSLSAKIIEDHCGDILIESVEGAGTTVTVSLPF